jgi:hypothetical protein
MPNFASIFKAVAPWLFTAASTLLPGPLATAAQKVGEAIGKDVKPDVQAIAEAVAGATPEQLQAIKAADQQYALAMQKAGFEHAEDLLKMNFDDTANARAREIAVRDNTPKILAYGVSILVLLCEGFMLLHGIPKTVDPVIAGRILGTLDSALILVLGYYFGSSRGSQEKDATIANLSK